MIQHEDLQKALDELSTLVDRTMSEKWNTTSKEVVKDQGLSASIALFGVKVVNGVNTLEHGLKLSNGLDLKESIKQLQTKINAIHDHEKMKGNDRAIKLCEEIFVGLIEISRTYRNELNPDKPESTPRTSRRSTR